MEMNSPDSAGPLAGRTLGTGKDSLVIAEWRDPGGLPPRFIALLLLHHNDEEAGYVTEGQYSRRAARRTLIGIQGLGFSVTSG